MSRNYKKRGRGASFTRDRSSIILITLLVSIGCLYYGLVFNESTGLTADQWTTYSDDYVIVCDDSGVFEPVKVEWADDSAIEGLTLSITSDWTAGCTSCTATVIVSGFLMNSGDQTGSFVVSNEDGTKTETQAVSISVNETSTNLMIIALGVICMVVCVYQIVRAR